MQPSGGDITSSCHQAQQTILDACVSAVKGIFGIGTGSVGGTKRVFTGFIQDKKQHAGLARNHGLIIQEEAVAYVDLRRVNFHSGVRTGIQETAAKTVQ